MVYQPRQRLTGESGFTLIELLVVILIIGILAAVAIPSFLNQKSKANDAQAKELARTAQTAAETLATDNSGSYAKVTTEELNNIEKSIPVKETKATAWLSAATEVEKGIGYEVTATAEPDGNTFTIKSVGGVVSHVCETPKKEAAGGCPTPGGSW